MSSGRLKCLSCDRSLGEEETFCTECGGVPFSLVEGGELQVVVGPIASMAFRRQAAELIADRVAGAMPEPLLAQLGRAVVVARGVDTTVGRALVERLARIPAEARVEPNGTGDGLVAQLLRPLPLALAGLGALAVPFFGFIALIAGLGFGLGVAALRSRDSTRPLLNPPVRPALPPRTRQLVEVGKRLEGEPRAALTRITAGGMALLQAARREGLPAGAAEVDGIGASVTEVMEEAVALGERAARGEDEAIQRLQELAQGVQEAVDKVGGGVLPARPEQRMLEAAEVVREVADINQSS